MEDDRITPYPLRLDPKLREKLQMKANKNGIPLSQQIINTLDDDAPHLTPIDNLSLRTAQIEERLGEIETKQDEIISLLEKLTSES